jgi:hypothetical protein
MRIKLKNIVYFKFELNDEIEKHNLFLQKTKEN